MINLHDIRYARLGTRDLDSAIAFATKSSACNWSPAKAMPPISAATGPRYAAIPATTRWCISRATRPTRHIGLELVDSDDLDAVGTVLEQAGRPVHFGTREECELRRTKAFIASSDPSGNKMEILARPITAARGSSRAATLASPISATSRCSARIRRRDTEFWTRLVNARVSDWLGDATFLRIGTVHHSVVLMPS